MSTRDGYGAGASNYQFRIPPDGCACFKYAQRTLELRNATTNATIEVFTPRSAALTSYDRCLAPGDYEVVAKDDLGEGW